MENITFNVTNSITEEIQKHKSSSHALSLLATLATDKQKIPLFITIECKSKENMDMIADDVLGNIVKSVANPAYLRSCKKNNEFQTEYFDNKNLEKTNAPPGSPSQFLKNSVVLVDVIINENSTEYFIYRKQEQNSVHLIFKINIVDELDKAMRTLTSLELEMSS